MWDCFYLVFLCAFPFDVGHWLFGYPRITATVSQSDNAAQVQEDLNHKRIDLETSLREHLSAAVLQEIAKML